MTALKEAMDSQREALANNVIYPKVSQKIRQHYYDKWEQGLSSGATEIKGIIDTVAITSGLTPFLWLVTGGDNPVGEATEAMAKSLSEKSEGTKQQMKAMLGLGSETQIKSDLPTYDERLNGPPIWRRTTALNQIRSVTVRWMLS